VQLAGTEVPAAIIEETAPVFVFFANVQNDIKGSPMIRGCYCWHAGLHWRMFEIVCDVNYW